MPSVRENNKRIAKNTMYLYIRMGIMMLVSLYTSRIVLANLGVENYGIYNVVGAFVTGITFIKGPLGSATQRFLNYEIGRGKDGDPNKIFNISFTCYIFLAIALYIILQIAGYWFLNNKINVPAERLPAAKVVFQISLITMVIGLFRARYGGLVTAYERMQFYAYVTIVDVFFKLFNAFSLKYFGVDKLILFSINSLLISIIMFIWVLIYTRKHFPHIRYQRIWDWQKTKEIFSFTSWSLFGSFATMTASKGVDIVLNIFCGVGVNAAMGLAGKVNTVLYNFVTSFEKAYKPQITKYYAAGKLNEMYVLMERTSKFSFYLLFAIICPVAFNSDFILRLWLGNVPMYTNEFTVLKLAVSATIVFAAPLYTAIGATGKIKNYQMSISFLVLMKIVLSYIFLRLGYSPTVVLWIHLFLEIPFNICRLYYAKRQTGFPIMAYMRNVFLPASCVAFISLIILYMFCRYMNNDVWQLIYSTLFFVVIYVPIVYFAGLNKKEKLFLQELVKTKLHINRVKNR